MSLNGSLYLNESFLSQEAHFQRLRAYRGVEVDRVDPAQAAHDRPAQLPGSGGDAGGEATAGAATVRRRPPLSVRGNAPPELRQHDRLVALLELELVRSLREFRYVYI